MVVREKGVSDVSPLGRDVVGVIGPGQTTMQKLVDYGRQAPEILASSIEWFIPAVQRRFDYLGWISMASPFMRRLISPKVL